MAEEISKANFNFSWDLFKKLSSKSPSENVFFSPASISAALCMALAGARGNSATEMSTTLRLAGIPAEKLHSAVGDMLATMNKVTDGVNMSLANKMYFEKTFEIVPEFINVLQKEYHAEMGQVDFINEFEPARLLINKWVEEQTNDKIKELLQGGSLTSLTKLVLVNAIYFKGMWQKQFDPEASYDGEFYRSANDENPKNVRYMYIKDKFNFGRSDELECSVLELPFKGETASMILILPNEVGELANLEAKLNADKLETLMNRTRRAEVEVHIPRFKLESTFNLESILPEMGMKDVFLEDRADFSGIHVGGEPVFISNVIHNACLEVNEEGATAAAATAIVLKTRSVMRSVEFYATHPFLVALVLDDNTTFFGAVRSPQPL